MKIGGVIADVRNNGHECLILASQIAWREKVPLWYIREPKKHGLQRSIEGDLDVLEKTEDIILITKYDKAEDFE